MAKNFIFLSPDVVHIPLWTKKGTITFPTDPSVPVIMVGPGTGVAPFRSFIHERSCQKIKGEIKWKIEKVSNLS